MQNAAPTLSTPQTDADYETLAEELLAQLRGINAHMDADRAESERLKAETNALKAHTARLRAETRAVLVSMGAWQTDKQHDHDMVARDRENLVLRLENYLLRCERGLPPPASLDEPPPPPRL